MADDTAQPRPGPQFRIKRLIVAGLERACDLTHPITHHRPWLWLPHPKGIAWHCPLADLSARLDERWGTRQWGEAR